MLVVVAVMSLDPEDDPGPPVTSATDEEEDKDDDNDDEEEKGEDEAGDEVLAPPIDKGTGILEWEGDAIVDVAVGVDGAAVGMSVGSGSRTPRSRKSRLLTASGLP